MSLVVEGVKRIFGTDRFGTLVTLAATSFLAAGLMFWLQSYGLWESFVRLGVSAAGIYGLLLQHVAKGGVRAWRGVTTVRAAC